MEEQLICSKPGSDQNKEKKFLMLSWSGIETVKTTRSYISPSHSNLSYESSMLMKSCHRLPMLLLSIISQKPAAIWLSP